MRHGFLLVDKPPGPTSHDIVSKIRHVLHEQSVGHIGTLDPQASGLLVLAVGTKALKVIEFFQGLGKEYIADVTFGKTSTTYDSDGVIEDYQVKPGVSVPEQIQIRNLISDRFIGKISQIPPAHSAIHVNGQRAYDLARKGKDIVMPQRTVQIDACDILSYEYPRVQLRVSCGSGTYIRSLANDLGEALRCGGYLSALRRTRVGEWSVENAVNPDDAKWTGVMPLKDVLKNFPSLELTQEEWEDIRHGRVIGRKIDEDTFAWFEGLPVAILINSERGTRARKVL